MIDRLLPSARTPEDGVQTPRRSAKVYTGRVQIGLVRGQLPHPTPDLIHVLENLYRIHLSTQRGMNESG